MINTILPPLFKRLLSSCVSADLSIKCFLNYQSLCGIHPRSSCVSLNKSAEAWFMGLNCAVIEDKVSWHFFFFWCFFLLEQTDGAVRSRQQAPFHSTTSVSLTNTWRIDPAADMSYCKWLLQLTYYSYYTALFLLSADFCPAHSFL